MVAYTASVVMTHLGSEPSKSISLGFQDPEFKLLKAKIGNGSSQFPEENPDEHGITYPEGKMSGNLNSF